MQAVGVAKGQEGGAEGEGWNDFDGTVEKGGADGGEADGDVCAERQS